MLQFLAPMVPEELHIIVLARAIAPLHGVGGLERHVHDLVRHLLERDVRVTLIVKGPSSSPVGVQPICHGETAPADADGGAIPISECFDHERLTTRFVPYRTFPFAGRRGTTVIDRSTAYPVFGWRAGRLAAELVRRGGVQLVHGMGAASLGYALARAKDWYGTVPLLFNPHGMEEFGSTGPELVGFKQWAYAPLRRAVRACARAADRVIATDRVLVPIVVKHLRVSERNVSVVPNAVDLREVDRRTDVVRARSARARLGLSSDEVLLVGVGRLEQNKGFHVLISALNELVSGQPGAPAARLVRGGRWRCVLIGEGPYRSQLEREVRAAGLEGSVLMPGRVGDAELHSWYEAATLFVHPTVYEGSSIVTLEAMAHRRAIVATSAGGLPDKVRPGTNGWLVAPGDASALARALDEALRHCDRLRSMGEESRAIIEREFTWTVVAARLLKLYGEILAGPGFGRSSIMRTNGPQRFSDGSMVNTTRPAFRIGP